MGRVGGATEALSPEGARLMMSARTERRGVYALPHGRRTLHLSDGEISEEQCASCPRETLAAWVGGCTRSVRERPHCRVSDGSPTFVEMCVRVGVVPSGLATLCRLCFARSPVAGRPCPESPPHYMAFALVDL